MANMLDYKAKMEMSRELATMTAQFCASVTMMFNARAGAST
jgi:roadblock/LC7 domain-containing protein